MPYIFMLRNWLSVIVKWTRVLLSVFSVCMVLSNFVLVPLLRGHAGCFFPVCGHSENLGENRSSSPLSTNSAQRMWASKARQETTACVCEKVRQSRKKGEWKYHEQVFFTSTIIISFNSHQRAPIKISFCVANLRHFWFRW